MREESKMTWAIIGCILFFPVFFLLLAVQENGCSNEQPVPENPTFVYAVPQKIVAVMGHWKMGEYVIGYRIVTDRYVIVTGYGGLFGQEGMGIQGPGLVREAIISSFAEIVQVAEQAETDNGVVEFYGDLRLTESGDPYLWGGKKVIDLYNATYRGRNYEVNRRPWDN